MFSPPFSLSLFSLSLSFFLSLFLYLSLSRLRARAAITYRDVYKIYACIATNYTYFWFLGVQKRKHKLDHLQV